MLTRSNKLRTLPLSVLCLLAGFLICSVNLSFVHAQTKPSAEQIKLAKEHFKRGRAYHDLRQYEEAAKEYLLAYKLSKAPKLLYNLGQVYWLKGERKKAARYFEIYLEEEPQGELSQGVRELMEDLRKEIAAEEKARAKAPPQEEENRLVQEPQQASDAINSELSRSQPPVTLSPSQGNGPMEGRWLNTRRKIAIGLGAVGVGALATGGVWTLQARGRWDDALAHCDENDRCDPEGLALGSEAGGLADRATIAAVTGVAALSAGIVLWFLSPSKEQSMETVTVHPIVGGSSAGMTIQGGFECGSKFLLSFF